MGKPGFGARQSLVARPAAQAARFFEGLQS